jgi:outer membrane lipoprotein-sorting protein
VLVGCARLLPPPREALGEDARRALGLLAQRWQEFSDLRSLADVRFSRGNANHHFQGVMLVRAPGSVRFEALTPFGPPLFLAVIHDNRLTTYNAATHEALIGEVTAESAARTLSFPFDPDDLVGILAGRPSPARDVRVARLLPPDEDGPSLGISGADWYQRVWMDLATGLVKQIEMAGGRYEVRVTYERDGDGRVTGFDFAAAQGMFSGSVRYRQAVFGAGIDPERFRLVIPAGAKVEELH